MKKCSIIAICICMLALCSCGNTSSKADEVKDTSSKETVAQTTTTEPEESSVPEETSSQVTAVAPEGSSMPETTTTKQDTTIIPGLSAEEQTYADNFLKKSNMSVEDLQLEKPEDMRLEDYLMFMRYLKVNGKSGHFSKKNDKPESSCFVLSDTFREEMADYKYVVAQDFVYTLCDFDFVKSISASRYEELSMFKEGIWCAYFKVDEYTSSWVQKSKEELGADNPHLSENGEYFFINWPEVNWEKYVGYWLIID